MTKIIPGDTSAWPHGAWRGPRGAQPSTPGMLRTTASLTPPCQTLPAPGQNIMRHNINKTFNIISLWSIPVPPACQLPPCLLCSRICRREQDLCRRQTPASWAACTASLWAVVLGCSVGLGETGRNPSVWGQHPPPAGYGGDARALMLQAEKNQPPAPGEGRNGIRRVGNGAPPDPPTPHSPPLGPGTIRARRRGRAPARWRGQPWSPPETPAASASRLRSAKHSGHSAASPRRGRRRAPLDQAPLD